MKTGRRPKLTWNQLRAIDQWWAQGRRVKQPMMKVMCERIGASRQTIRDAALRQGGYAECEK